MAGVLRHLVSKKKKRYIQDGFDLDLTYITPRIISMGFPSEGREGIFRNPMPEVIRFFEQNHKDHYKIYNLCSERSYDPAKFHNRVEVYPFDDHNAPPLDLIEQFCTDVVEWFAKNPEHVAVVHCKAGKGRTGCMISCLLLRLKNYPTAAEALKYFGDQRTANGKGVTIPSQIRYVHYYSRLLAATPAKPFCTHPMPASGVSNHTHVTRTLSRVTISPVPNFDVGGGCDPFLQVFMNNKKAYQSEVKFGAKGRGPLEMSCDNLVVCGDVKIIILDKDRFSQDKMCHFWFNTCMIDDDQIVLTKQQIDKALKDKACKNFDADFTIEVFFDERSKDAKPAKSMFGGQMFDSIKPEAFVDDRVFLTKRPSRRKKEPAATTSDAAGSKEGDAKPSSDKPEGEASAASKTKDDSAADTDGKTSTTNDGSGDSPGTGDASGDKAVESNDIPTRGKGFRRDSVAAASRAIAGATILTGGHLGLGRPSIATMEVVRAAELKRQDSADLTDPYRQGGKVWLPHPTEVYKTAVITSSTNDQLIVAQDGEEIIYKKNDPNEPLPDPRNSLEGVDDLGSLHHLHEAALVHNLRVRYNSDTIYTMTGPILIVVNPFQDLPLYTPPILAAYARQNPGLGPHIFAVASEAHRSMILERKDQSIVLSGESGAGKTVACKHVLRYLATVSQAETADGRGSEGSGQVEVQLIASNPIMEAFGNAKTTRNDNSSRFGKWIEVQFDRNDRLCGARVQTYLLEKSRVVEQQSDERNYHIFYQLLAGAKDLQLTAWDLERDATKYHILNQGGCVTVDGVNDEEEFHNTVASLKTMNIPQSKIDDLFSVMAALLHLGNVEITVDPNDDDKCAIAPDNAHLVKASELLGVELTVLRMWLTHRSVAVSRGSMYEIAFTVKQATEARNSFIKLLYSLSFDWLVDTINSTIAVKNLARGHVIGVLDIYGFESFKVNSFEQLCINYANERLQALFAKYVFKDIQDEFEQEGIDWKRVDYPDNSPCVELIEKKLGVLSLLDEECNVPKGTSSTLLHKLNENLRDDSSYIEPKVGNDTFGIKHFADDVMYDVDRFLEKNKDYVINEHLQLLAGSSNPILPQLPALHKANIPSRRSTAAESDDGVVQTTSSRGSSSSYKFHSVSSTFRTSLQDLVAMIDSTEPHFVRCIKPNSTKRPTFMDNEMLVRQLRAVGLVSTVKIMSAVRFPVRIPFEEFDKNYWQLRKDLFPPTTPEQCRQNTIDILSHISDSTLYKIGKTKVFCTPRPLEMLQERLRKKLHTHAVKVQAHARAWFAKKVVEQRKVYRSSAICIQTAFRVIMAKNKLSRKRTERKEKAEADRKAEEAKEAEEAAAKAKAEKEAEEAAAAAAATPAPASSPPTEPPPSGRRRPQAAGTVASSQSVANASDSTDASASHPRGTTTPSKSTSTTRASPRVTGPGGEVVEVPLDMIKQMVKEIDDHSGAYSSQLDSLKVLTDASVNPANQRHIVVAGGLDRLLEWMKVPNEGISLQATRAVANVATNEANQSALLAAPTLETLVSLLKAPAVNIHIKRQCARAVAQLASQDDAAATVVELPGALEGLVALLASDISEAQRQGARALAILSRKPDYCRAIGEKGAVPYLVRLTRSPIDPLCMAAVIAVSNLSDVPENMSLVMGADGATALIKCCEHESTSIKSYAAKALFNLAAVDANRQAIIDAPNAPSILVGLARNGSEPIQYHAAATIAQLTKDPAQCRKMYEVNAVDAVTSLVMADIARQTRLYAAFSLANLGEMEQRPQLIPSQMQALDVIVRHVSINDQRLSQLALQIFSALVRDTPKHAKLVDAGLVETLANLVKEGQNDIPVAAMGLLRDLTTNTALRKPLKKRKVTKIVKPYAKSGDSKLSGIAQEILANMKKK